MPGADSWNTSSGEHVTAALSEARSPISELACVSPRRYLGFSRGGMRQMTLCLATQAVVPGFSAA